MRARISFVAALLVICLLSAGLGKPYEFIETDRNVALFRNLSNSTFAGLRLVFGGDVTPLQAIGIGTRFALTSNEAGILLYHGTIAPYGMFEVDWSLDGPRLDAAFWIDAEGLEHEIDVHSPYARIWFQLPPGTDECDDGCLSYVPIAVEFRGNWSKDPDRLPLVRYQWSWSDGVTLDGANVFRTFRIPGDYTVTLTVWDAEGLADSATETFPIYHYRSDAE